jgi:hypothetical protein
MTAQINRTWGLIMCINGLALLAGILSLFILLLAC